MFNIFKKDRQSTVTIVSKVTKSSSQVNFEKEVYAKVKEKTKICPECGYFDNEESWIGYCKGDGSRGYSCDCKKCGAEYDVNYRL